MGKKKKQKKKPIEWRDLTIKAMIDINKGKKNKKIRK